MKINDAGLELIKRFEGFRQETYLCPRGIPTIGYGHTGYDVRMGMRVTCGEAEAYLRQDVGQAERSVAHAVKVPLNTNQFSALVSFTYNLGGGALKSSTLLKRLNAGNYEAAADEILRWDKIKQGKKKIALSGLTKRRHAERELFLEAVECGG